MTIVAIYIIYICVSIFIINRKKNKSIYYLIPIFICLEITNVYLSEINKDTGVNGLYFIVLFLFVILNIKVNSRLKKTNALFILIIFLLGILMVYNISPDLNVINSISRFGNFILVLILIPLTISNSKAIGNLELLKLFRYSVLIYLGYVIIASLFNYGPNHYNTGLIYGFKFEQWYFAALAVVIYPYVMLEKSKFKYIDIIIFFTLLLVALLVLRRTVWIIIAGSFIVYLLINGNFKANIKYWFLFMFLIFPLLFLIAKSDVWDVRGDRTIYSSVENIEDESRFLELINTVGVLKSSNSILIGTGYMFDEQGRYFHPNPNRSMHGTYSRILFGTGLIGLTMFLTFLFYVIFKLYKKNRTNDDYLTTMLLSSYIIYVIVAITGASGIGLGISYIGTLNILSGYIINK